MPHAPHVYPHISVHVYASCSQYIHTHIWHLFPMYITAHIYASFSHVCSHTLMLSFTHIYPHLYAFCSPCIPTDICLMLPMYTYTHMLYMLHVPTHMCFMCSFYQHIWLLFSIYTHTIYASCASCTNMLTPALCTPCTHTNMPFMYTHTYLVIASFVPCIYTYKCTGICFKCPMKWFL